MFRFRHLFFIPSFYMLVMFSAGYFFYLLRVIRWETAPAELHIWCLLTILTALLSTLAHSRACNHAINSKDFRETVSGQYLDKRFFYPVFFAALVIGFAGVIKFILDYSNFLGTFDFFLMIFFNDTGQLRTMSGNVESAGTQLSYFSWIAAFLISIFLGARKISKWWILVLILIVLANSIFLDRTRPVWILFMCVLIFFFTRYHEYSRKKIALFMSGTLGFFVTIFLLIGALLGKGADDRNEQNFGLPSWTQPVFLYLSSSFAYLGRLLYNDLSCDYQPVRILYPLQKFLAKMQIAKEPPEQILDFVSVPLLTNVGTYLTPFFQDGGRLFMVIGILIHTFLFDMIVLRLMRNMHIFSVLAIATFCFINFIAFFTPKMSSTATWFILIFSGILVFMSPRRKTA